MIPLEMPANQLFLNSLMARGARNVVGNIISYFPEAFSLSFFLSSGSMCVCMEIIQSPMLGNYHVRSCLTWFYPDHARGCHPKYRVEGSWLMESFTLPIQAFLEWFVLGRKANCNEHFSSKVATRDWVLKKQIRSLKLTLQRLFTFRLAFFWWAAASNS